MSVAKKIYIVTSKLIMSHIYDKSYLTGRWFDNSTKGWRWCWQDFFMQKIIGFNKNVPFPVSHRIKIGDYRNLIFDIDDLNNFQSFGCYYQNYEAKIIIGKGSYIAPNVGLITQNHDIYDLDKHVEGKDIIIGQKCWIGMNTVILPGVELGDSTIVGAGSIVTKSFKEGNCVIVGNPARIIRNLDNQNDNESKQSNEEAQNRYRIAIVTPFYPIEHRTDLKGDTNVVYYLIQAFDSKHDVMIIHSYMHPFRTAIKNLSGIISYKKINDFLHKDDRGNLVFFMENYFLIPKSDYLPDYFNRKYARILKGYFTKKEIVPEVGVVHFPTYYVGFLKYLDIFPKKIAVLHATDIKKIKNSEEKTYWSTYFSKFDALGFRSPIIKKQFYNLININKPNFLCLSGVPASYLNKPNDRLNYSKKTPLKLVYAGKLDENKNVHSILLALSKLKYDYEFIFDIIGSGPYYNNLLQLREQLNLQENVRFLGRMSRDEVFNHMQNSDIFVMVSRKETFGLVYLEALAAGCIVVGTEGQGIDGIIIDGKNGFLVNLNHQEYLEEKLRQVFSLTNKQQKDIRNQGFSTVKDMSEENMSLAYLSNIEKVIRNDIPTGYF